MLCCVTPRFLSVCGAPCSPRRFLARLNVTYTQSLSGIRLLYCGIEAVRKRGGWSDFPLDFVTAKKNRRGSQLSHQGIALISALNRRLCRAALLRWMSPLPTALSMTGTAALKASAAACLSPTWMSLTTFFMAVRIALRKDAFCRRRFSAWRARFLAWAELAKLNAP